MDRLYLGADVGGTKIAFLLRDENEKTICAKTIPAPHTPDGLKDAVCTLLSSQNISPESIGGFGMGLPGCVDKNGYFVYDVPIFGWKNIDLRQTLFSSFAFPCIAGNDVNTALLGECAEGAARNTSDAIFISIGTGLGGAILADGHIVTGFGGLAGEIGYFADETDLAAGKKYTAESYGALESKCSGTGLDTLGKPFGLSAKTLFSEAIHQNEDAARLIEDFLNRLAVTAANCASLLNPEKIIFGGGLSTELPPYMSKLEEKVSSLTPTPVTLCVSALGRNAGAVGAYHLARSIETK